jgi:glycopeptide antibiotics resistance protein
MVTGDGQPATGNGGALMVQSGIVVFAWPVAAALVVFWQVRRHASVPQVLGAVALATYALWICSVTFFPIPLLSAETSPGAGDLVGRPWVNLIPVRDLLNTLPRLTAGQIVREFGGNLLLLVPFTLFAPMLWPRLRSWWWPLAAGLGGSLAIELIQLGLSLAVGYPYRQADVDDVIINTAGAFLGYAVFVLLSRRSRAGG